MTDVIEQSTKEGTLDTRDDTLTEAASCLMADHGDTKLRARAVQKCCGIIRELSETERATLRRIVEASSGRTDRVRWARPNS